MNFNTLSFSRADFASSNRLGFYIGPKVRVKVPLLGFGADASLLYSLNTAKVNRLEGGVETSTTRSLSYVEIPVNLRYTFDLRILSAYLATGPQFNYCLSKYATIMDLYGSDLDGFSRSTWGWNVGAGVELFHHLQVGVSYTIPISNSGELKPSTVPGAVLSNFDQKTVKVRLAYYF